MKDGEAGVGRRGKGAEMGAGTAVGAGAGAEAGDIGESPSRGVDGGLPKIGYPCQPEYGYALKDEEFM